MISLCVGLCLCFVHVSSSTIRIDDMASCQRYDLFTTPDPFTIVAENVMIVMVVILVTIVILALNPTRPLMNKPPPFNTDYNRDPNI